MNRHKHHSCFDRCRSGWFGRDSRQGQSGFDRRSGIMGRTFYRSRRGMLMGVCRGISDRFNISVTWVRIIVLVLFLFTGFWPVGILYILAGLVLKLEPVIPFQDERDHEFYHSYTASRESAIQRIKRKFDNIDRRIQRMEHTVTSKEFKL